MDHPDEALLDMIKNNWSLTDTGLKAKDIRFTQINWRAGGTDVVEALKALFGVYNISIERRFLRRLADVDEFFNYQAIVHVVYWSETKDPDDVKTDKDNLWKIIEEIKKQCHTSGNWSADWNHVKVDTSMVRNIVPPIPPMLHEEITVSIRLFWEPS